VALRHIVERAAVVESATVIGCGTHRIVNRWLGRWAWLGGVACAIVLGCLMYPGIAQGQGAQGFGGQGDGASTMHGKVLNQITKEPIGRALVTMPEDQYATLTNDRGQFEFRFPLQEGGAAASVGGTAATVTNSRRGTTHMLLARKPGYLQGGPNGRPLTARLGQSGVTIYLVPEALIVGHVTVPESEGDVRIECELIKREVRDGQEIWSPAGTFTTWADGEFRFSELEAGTYKLITHEQMDRDSLPAVPGAQLFGYPPIYHQNTTDFSAASAIEVKAGETAQANLTVARREYHPVRIAVTNAPTGQPLNLVVYPMGHHGPGWSLGFNPAESVIEGLLPDGNYTLEVDTPGEAQETGMLNFSVKGAALEGPVLNMIPNSPLNVNVREEFQSKPEGGADVVAKGQGVPEVHVTLSSMDEFGRNGRSAGSEVVEGSDAHTLVIKNVRPGRYRVNVFSGRGYAASIQSGGSDLRKQPLVVGLGGGTPPIEVTLRDDGAEVSCTVEEPTGAERSSEQNGENLPSRYVYLLPEEEGGGQLRQMNTGQGNTFKVEQVPPGNYLVVAFDQVQRDLPYGSAEALSPLEGKGQMIHVEEGQRVNVKVKVIGGGDGE